MTDSERNELILLQFDKSLTKEQLIQAVIDNIGLDVLLTGITTKQAVIDYILDRQ